MRLATLATVKFLSRLLTALNLLPSIATTARVNKLNWRHNTRNRAQAARIAGPLSRGTPARLNAVEIAVNVKLEQIARRIARASRRLRLDPRKSSRLQVEGIHEGV